MAWRSSWNLGWGANDWPTFLLWRNVNSQQAQLRWPFASRHSWFQREAGCFAPERVLYEHAFMDFVSCGSADLSEIMTIEWDLMLKKIPGKFFFSKLLTLVKAVLNQSKVWVGQWSWSNSLQTSKSMYNIQLTVLLRWQSPIPAYLDHRSKCSPTEECSFFLNYSRRTGSQGDLK